MPRNYVESDHDPKCTQCNNLVDKAAREWFSRKLAERNLPDRAPVLCSLCAWAAIQDMALLPDFKDHP